MILSLFLLCSLYGQAEGLTIKPTNPGETITKETDYTYVGDLLTVKTATPVTISSGGVEIGHTIAVAEVMGATATITLDNVNIKKSQRSPFDIQGNASVSLVLVGVNVLTSEVSNGHNDYPALRCENKGDATASLEIKGTGELRATTSSTGNQIRTNAAGIGGGNQGSGGKIVINGGTVTATVTAGTYSNGAGIGGGNDGASGGDITINGGTVTATCSGSDGAGIGGGYGGAGGKITISGGTVTATCSGGDGAGIGGGYFGAGGEITISGGIVTATANSGTGIGGGAVPGTGSGEAGTFKTTDKNGNLGNAFIIATSIQDKNNQSSWSGVIFEKNAGQVYGTPTLPEGVLTIPSGKTLTVEDGKTLAVGSGTTLINEGTITNNGTISNDGVLAVKGTLTNNATYGGSGALYELGSPTLDGFNSSPLTSAAMDGVVITFEGNGGSDAVSNLPSIQVITKSTGYPTKPTVTPLRANYTFVGWSESSSGRTIIADETWGTTTLSDNKTYHAVWKYNTKLVFTAGSYSYTYGNTAPTVEATVTGDGSNPPTEIITYAYYSDAGCTQSVSDTPADAGTYYVKATYPGDAYNVEASITTAYVIGQKELTVTPVTDQSIYSDEHPAYTVSVAVGEEQPTFTGNLKVDNAKVVDDNLTLTDDEASGFKAANYTWALSSSDVSITQDNKTLAEAYEDEANRISGAVGTGWHKADVVLTPSSGFQIKGSSTLRSSSDDWKDQLTVDGVDGIYNVTYSLLREGRTTRSGDQTLTVNLDKTLPSVAVTPDSPNKLTLTVALSDATSGLASCTYNWNGSGDVVETLTPGEPSHSFTLTAAAAGSYPLKVVLTDQAGNETTYNETVTLTAPDKPVDPPVTPPVDPPVGPSEPEITYTVTLPAVEGAATDPAAGDYEVTDWSSFGFLLTLDAAYNQSAPIVTTDRGETIEPRASDGKYIIKQVRSDVSVSISGIVKNPDPVANEEVSSPALRIYTAEGILCLDVPTATEAWLITADGRLLRSLTLSPGLNRVYGLRQGVYIVRLKDGTTRKVLIG